MTVSSPGDCCWRKHTNAYQAKPMGSPGRQMEHFLLLGAATVTKALSSGPLIPLSGVC